MGCYWMSNVKNCAVCSIELVRVHHAVKYCDGCREGAYKAHFQRRNLKRNKQRTIENDMENKLKKNFSDVIKKPYHLTTKGFEEISDIKIRSYTNFYRVKWIEILDLYGKKEELLNYVVNEYKKYILLTNKQALRAFSDQHQYLNIGFVDTLNPDTIRELAGVKKMRNTSKDYKENFWNLINELKRVPLYSEFIEYSRIGIGSYANHLGVTNTGKVYENIVKAYTTDNNLLNEYYMKRSENKTLVGRSNHQGYKHSDEDLKANFTDVFEEYFALYESYPTKRTFNQISKIDDSVYNHRYDTTWFETCEKYGYKLEREYKTEKMVLDTISDIVGCNYEPQKTFKWLLSIKNFPLFCDGYFNEASLVVEFDGDQHRKPVEFFGGEKVFKIVQANDEIKNKLIPENGLILIRISSDEPYWDKDYLTLKLLENGIKINQKDKQIS